MPLEQLGVCDTNAEKHLGQTYRLYVLIHTQQAVSLNQFKNHQYSSNTTVRLDKFYFYNFL